MWSPLVLATALTLAPAQDGDLNLTNARVTYGTLGATRNSTKLLPGDLFMVSFDIENITVGPDGKVLYSMGMELLNKDGKPVFKKEPQDLETYNTLGGSRLPAFAVTNIGLDTPPGEYTMSVEVVDRVGKKRNKLKSEFQVLPMAFGIVQFNTTFDVESRVPAPPVAVPGLNYWVNFALVGFELDKDKQPNLSVELQVLENGKPTNAKGMLGEATEVTEQFKKIVPMQFKVNLNRPGNFTLRLTARDNVGKKTAEQEVRFTVLDLNSR
jgi:hypothetical protein